MKKLFLALALVLFFCTAANAMITPDYVNASDGVGVAGKYFGGLEMEFYHDPVTSFTATNTPASGTCDSQIQLKNMGVNVSGVKVIPFYISSDNAGATPEAVTSLAAVTNGAVIQPTAAVGFAWAVSKSDGTVGIRITDGAGAKYINLILEGGDIITGAVCTVN